MSEIVLTIEDGETDEYQLVLVGNGVAKDLKAADLDGGNIILQKENKSVAINSGIKLETKEATKKVVKKTTKKSSNKGTK